MHNKTENRIKEGQNHETDREDEKYQILKVRKDCIPLSDRELRQLKDEYLKSTLLYKKAKDSRYVQNGYS